MNKDFSIAGIVGRIIQDTRRARKDDTYPVKIRITFNRESMYVAPGFSYTVKDFERLERTRDNDLINERELLVAELDRIKGHVTEILKEGDYSHDKLNTRIRRGKTENIIDYIDHKIDEIKHKQPGNASIYTNTKKFLQKHAGDDLKFKEVSPKFLELLQDKALHDMRQTTCSIYMRTLRAVFNSAIDEGILDDSSYPFSRKTSDKKFSIKPGSGTKTALNAAQIAQIAAYQVPKYSPALRRSRDLFLLMFHMGGISIIDLLLLKWSNIKGNEIRFERKKTKRTVGEATIIRVPLTKTVQGYLDLYGTQDHSPDNYILPYLLGAKNEPDIRRISQNFTRIINKHLYLIAKDLDLPKVSTYVSRHSYATITKNSGASESFIKEQLGHRNLATTQNYLKGFEDNQRREHFEQLEQIIQDNGKDQS